MRRALCICLLGLVLLVPVAAAHADFSEASLLSSVPPLQFDEAGSPAFASDGEYVVFDGTLAGVPGIYRRDLRTGQVTLVVGANSEAELNAPDAAAPSISAEGRYVAFTTAHDLDAAVDTGGSCPEVYVRDMDQPLVPDKHVEEEDVFAASKHEPAPVKPYTLASAVNGGSEGLAYEKPCTTRFPSELFLGGAQAAPGVALSANGQQVAFTVLSASNLTGPCTGAPVSCPTPPSQVAVRDLETDTTRLVSATPTGQPTPGGGAFPSTVAEQRLGDIYLTGGEVGSSAAISADGDVVAWQGTNVPEQVPRATDVTTGMSSLGGPGLEVEPLWRQIGEGPKAVTKRLLAGAGLNFYFPLSHENSEVIEGGALAPAQTAFVAPALDADGHTVAVPSNAPTAANEGSYQYIGYRAVPPTDAYVAHVGEGEAAQVQVTPLTATPNFAANKAILDGVGGLTISANGSRVAFNSKRVSFALAPPTLISPPTLESIYAYTYEVNLVADTLQRVTSTYTGSPPNGEPGQLSLDGEGSALTFASSAGNIFYGDATPGVSQVFLTEELASVEQPLPQNVGAPPSIELPRAEWLLSVTATPQKDGSVLLYAEVPGSGKLEAVATAQLPDASKEPVRKHGKGKARKAGVSGTHKASVSLRMSKLTVAHASMVAAGASQLGIRLHLRVPYNALASRKNGLYTILSVSFSAPGRSTLRRQIPVSFRRQATPSKQSKTRSKHDSGHHHG